MKRMNLGIDNKHSFHIRRRNRRNELLPREHI